MPTATEIITGVKDSIDVRRVFGDPIEREGVTVVPVAAIMGGAGGGEGGEGAAQGTGSGFGVRARPVGAYTIKEGNVTWQPAFDLVRVIMASLVFATISAVMAGIFMRKRASTYVIEDMECPPTM